MTAKVVKTKRIPPDGGWGWVVLMSALVVNFLIPGTVKSFGVLFVEFLHVFKASSTAASWMPALCYFLYNSLGPLSSVLSTKYSYKTVTLIGGTFAASGMMISYFANSVSFLYVSYGLMVGIGAGLSFPPTVYIVTAYFERLRGFANGLCISGSAIGTIVLPPFLQYLLDCFGYRGAVLIMGAITLNTLVCGLLYHPVEQHMIEVPVEEGIDNEALSLDEPTLDVKEKVRLAIEEKPRPTIEEKTRPIEDKQLVVEQKQPSDEKQMPTKLQLHFQDPADREATTKQLKNLAEVLDRKVLNLSVERESKRESEKEKEKEAQGEKNASKELALIRRDSVKGEETEKKTEKTEESPENEAEGQNKDEDETTRAKDDMFSASRRGSFINHVVARSNSKLSRISSVKTDVSLQRTLQRCPSRASTVDTSQMKGSKNSCVNSASRFFDFSVLRDPIYLVILISNSTSAISNTNFMILLPSYAISQGFDKNSSALLLSVVSALDLVGRIGGASLSDIDFVPKYYYFVGGLGTSGIALALLPMATSYAMLAFFCALFGLSSGMYIGITTVILADMLGTEKLSSSYGISLFVNGVLQLVGPPVCGVIYENVGTYKPIFLAFGIILILGTALWAVVPLINRTKKKNVEAV